jgi:dolichyl-phosphate beta-glucosyltransferase
MISEHKWVDFHLVIPCFEESKRLSLYFKTLIPQLEQKRYHCQILVVDDGSSRPERDKLAKLLLQYQTKYAEIMSPLFLERNRGKGYAIRAGWDSANSARWLAFVDADGATPASEVARIFDFVHQKNDDRTCYLCSRIKMLGRSVDRNWKRHLMGRIYATLVGITISQSVYDSQCGFKIISSSAFDAVREVLAEDRFAFDVELIAALIEAGFRLEEIPIDWSDIPGSRISTIKDSTRMVKSLFQIRKRRKKWMLSNRDS